MSSEAELGGGRPSKNRVLKCFRVEYSFCDFRIRKKGYAKTVFQCFIQLFIIKFYGHLTKRSLIAVGIGLVGSILGDSDVLALLVREDSELGTKTSKVEPGDLLVKDLGENIDVSPGVLASFLLLPELKLGKGLVSERGTHHETRVSGGAPQVKKTSLGKDNDAVSILEGELVNLGLDVGPGGDLHEAVHVDLVIEVADVSDDGVVLHLLHGFHHQDALVTGGGDEDISPPDNLLEGGDSEALHARLKGADGVDLSNVDDASAGPHGLGASLSYISESADDSLLTGHHDVSGAHDTIGETVLAAVKVVKLTLGDRVVDVDGAEEEGSGLLHGIKAVDSGGSLLGDTNKAVDKLVPLVSDSLLKEALDDGQNNLELGVVSGLGVGQGSILEEEVLGLLSLVDEEGHVTSIIDDHVGSVSLAIISGPSDSAESAVPVLLEGLSLPSEDGGRLVAGNGSGGVVLGTEDVATAPAHVSSEILEGLNEDGSLDGHVEGSGNTGSSQRLGSVVLLSGGHEARHLNLSDLNLLATEIGKRNVGNLCESK